MEYDFLFKVLVIGQTGVGKTSLLNRYVDDTFAENTFSTIGVDYKLKSLTVKVKELERTVKLQLWDTAGQERFQSITVSYFRGANGVMLVFALDSLESFQRLQFWMDMVENQHVDHQVLVGNKCDVEKRTVTEEMIDAFCKAHPGLMYMETSAKTGKWVDYAFSNMATNLAEAMTDFRMEKLRKDGPIKVSAQPDEEVDRSSKCCGGTG